MLKLRRTSANQRIFGTGLLVILTDQLLKWLIRSQDLFFLINKGGAFSLGADYWWFKWTVWGAFILVLCIMYQVLSVNKQTQNTKYKTSSAFAWALLVGGAASNLIDRIFVGGVIDYISVWKFPVFNLADISIYVGLISLLLSGYLSNKKNSQHLGS